MPKSIITFEEEKLKELLGKIQKEAPTEDLAYSIAQYSLDRRPFAIPEKFIQNEESLAERLEDSLCGIPFFSQKHPWPKCKKNGLWMKSIAQINLTNYKNIFDVDWGDGLIQIWSVPRLPEEEFAYENTFQLRHIPAKDLEHIPSIAIPDWKTAKGKQVRFTFDTTSYANDVKQTCKWKYAGQMTGSREHLLNIIHKRKGSLYDEDFEWVDSVMEQLSDSPLCGQNQSEFLCGWGGQNGEQDASLGDGLILRLTDFDYTTIAIHRDEGRSPTSQFSLNFSLM